MTALRGQRDKWVYPAVVFILLNSFGFPGNLTLVFGDALGTLIEYGAFLLMIAIMLLTSADNIADILVLDLKAKYTPVYLFTAVLFCTSMIITRFSGTELITCVRLTVTVLFALWACEYFSLQEMLRLVYITQIIFIAFNLLFVTVFRSYVYRESAGYANDFVGLFSAKNGIGSELAFGIMMQLLLGREYRFAQERVSLSFVIVLTVQILLLALTHNWSSFICLAVPVIWLILYDRRGGAVRLPLGWIYIIGSIGFIIVALTVIPIFTPLFEAIGKDATLTGRIPLWRQALKVLRGKYLLTGYGYGMFWRNPSAVKLLHSGFDEYSFMAQQMSGAHNVLIEMLLNSGILGIGAFFAAMIACMKRPRELEEKNYVFCACFVLLFMIYGFTERSFGTHEFLTLFLFYTMGLACSKAPLTGNRITGQRPRKG
ncbi:MAG: O-antigen ligase family protein [Clostridia bacterium]|nr:O-antigen ligase family protein [Clostridia bacterium]